MYISSDTDEQAMMKDFKLHHAEWFAVSLNEKRRIIELKRHFNTVAIPMLIVLSPEMQVMTLRGRSEIECKGMHAIYSWLVAAKLYDPIKFEIMMTKSS